MLFKHLGGPAKAIALAFAGFPQVVDSDGRQSDQFKTGGPAKAIAWPLLGFQMLLIQEARQRPLLGLCWTSRSTSSKSLIRSGCSSDRLTTIQIHRMDVKFFLYYIIWFFGGAKTQCDSLKIGIPNH